MPQNSCPQSSSLGELQPAATSQPAGFWACNVVDPCDFDYASLAAAIGRRLHWKWEPEIVPFETTDHPWQVHHPVLCSDHRLRNVLNVSEPETSRSPSASTGSGSTTPPPDLTTTAPSRLPILM